MSLFYKKMSLFEIEKIGFKCYNEINAYNGGLYGIFYYYDNALQKGRKR